MNDNDPIPPGTQTEHGEVLAVGFVGERYYWLADEHGDIAMLPADVVEEDK